MLIKKKYTSIKNFKFFNLPRNPIITLKRFEFNRDLNIKLKLNKYFEFPYILYLNSYMIPSNVNDNKFNDNYKYILKSIVILKGNTENGHYWSIIRDAKSYKWIKFDDTNVKEISVLDVKNNSFGLKNDEFLYNENNNNAYIIFYSKYNDFNCEKMPDIKSIESLKKIILKILIIVIIIIVLTFLMIKRKILI